MAHHQWEQYIYFGVSEEGKRKKKEERLLKETFQI